MRDNIANWTRDAEGKLVDWTKPPYKVGGVLNRVLPGETEVSQAELSKRLDEYTALTQRAMWGQNENAPRERTQRGVGSRQGQLI